MGKEKIYNRLPLWVGPSVYFFYRYLFQFGFLDGRSGLIYHFLQGFWYRFLVNAKVVEYEVRIENCGNNGERLDVLSRLTGYNLTKESVLTSIQKPANTVPVR